MGHGKTGNKGTAALGRPPCLAWRFPVHLEGHRFRFSEVENCCFVVQAQNRCRLCQNGIPARFCFVSFGVCIGLAFSYFVSNVGICFWEETFPCTLICTICLFKLVGNFKTRQSVPYAGISAAISETYLKKSNRAIRQGVFSVK